MKDTYNRLLNLKNIKNILDNYRSAKIRYDKSKFYVKSIYSIYSRISRLLGLKDFSVILNDLEQIIPDKKQYDFLKFILKKYEQNELTNFYINSLNDIKDDLKIELDNKPERKNIKNQLKFLSKNQNISNKILLVKWLKYFQKNDSNDEFTKNIKEQIEKLEKMITPTENNNIIYRIFSDIDKFTKSNKVINKILSIANDVFQVMTSNIVMNSIWIVTSVISYLTASAVSGGILPIISLASTLIIITSSIIFDVVSLRNYKNLRKEETYLNEASKLIKSKKDLLNELEITTESNIERSNIISNSRVRFNKPSLLRSSFKVIREKAIGTSVMLFFNIINFNPINIAISVGNSILSHVMGSLSRKDRDEQKNFIKDSIIRLSTKLEKNNFYYDDLNDLEFKCQKLKKQVDILENIKKLKDDSSEKNRKINEFKEPKNLSYIRENIFVRLENTIIEITKNISEVLNPFYSKEKLGNEAKKRIKQELVLAVKKTSYVSVAAIFLGGILNNISVESIVSLFIGATAATVTSKIIESNKNTRENPANNINKSEPQEKSPHNNKAMGKTNTQATLKDILEDNSYEFQILQNIKKELDEIELNAKLPINPLQSNTLGK